MLNEEQKPIADRVKKKEAIKKEYLLKGIKPTASMINKTYHERYGDDRIPIRRCMSLSINFLCIMYLKRFSLHSRLKMLKFKRECKEGVLYE